MVWIKTMIDVFKKITVDFDYMKLRNDVNHVYHTIKEQAVNCLLYTSPSPRDATLSRMPSSA